MACQRRRRRRARPWPGRTRCCRCPSSRAGRDARRRARMRRHAGHRQRRFVGRAARPELPVRVERIGVPAVDGLVRPGADAGQDEHIDHAGMAIEVALDPLEGAVDAAGLVAVDAAGDDHRRAIGAPVPAAHGMQRIGSPSQRRAVQLAVLEQLRRSGQPGLQRCDDVVGMAAPALLSREPRALLGRAPRRARNADRIRRRVAAGALVMSIPSAFGTISEVIARPHPAAARDRSGPRRRAAAPTGRRPRRSAPACCAGRSRRCRRPRSSSSQ